MLFRKVIIAIILGLFVQQGTADVSGSTKNNFFLLSKVTSENRLVDEDAFKQAYENMVSSGTVFYRNGQKYTVIVPVKKVYYTGTVNYIGGGSDVVKQLSDFLAIYEIENAKFTGVYFKQDEKEKKVSNEQYSFKGDYGKESKNKNNGELEKKQRVLPKDLVSLKQASHLAKTLQASNAKMAKINISVTKGVYENGVFSTELEAVSTSEESSTKEGMGRVFSEVADTLEEVSKFDDGAIMIEFKKY